jgi:hypothetical protein
MTLPSTGALSLSQVQTEFGGSNPISMSEYYAGGARVAAGASGVLVLYPQQVLYRLDTSEATMFPTQVAYSR